MAIPWLVLGAGYKDEDFFSEDLEMVPVMLVDVSSPCFRRESKSIKSIRSFYSFSSNKEFGLSKACLSLNVRQSSYSGLSFSNMFGSNNFRVNK